MAVGRQAKEIDGKVCAKKKVNGKTGRAGESSANERGRWSCVDYGPEGSGTHNHVIEPDEKKTLSWRFGDIAKIGLGKNIAEDSDKNLTNQGWPSTGAKTNDTFDAMAEDIRSKLNREQRHKVAGLLSKTVSGAEVVEIRAVSTTSVMLNVCYDLQSEGLGAWTF